MDQITFEGGVLYLPANEADVQQLIAQAKTEGKKLRVRGAAHSVDKAVYTEGYGTPSGSAKGIDIMLSKMNAVTFDDAKMQVTVQAGCHLGLDPFDPSGISTTENSLFYQLNAKGWAVPDMGGIIHQAVGGFISTGSSGGSTTFDFSDAIVAIRLIDGSGTVHDMVKSDNLDDPFYAAGVSMGLLGVITQVTFQCIPAYDIKGWQLTTTYDKCKVDLFGPGTAAKPSLQQYLTSQQYTRLMWWPQKDVDEMVIWEAQRMTPADYNKETNPPDGPPASPFKPKPYLEFPVLLGSQIPAQLGASFFYWLVGTWPTWFRNAFGEQGAIKSTIEAFLKEVGGTYLEEKDFPGRLEEYLENLINQLLNRIKGQEGQDAVHAMLKEHHLSLVAGMGVEKQILDWMTPDHLEKGDEAGLLEKVTEKLDDLIPDSFKEKFWEQLIETLYVPVILPMVIKLFTPVDPEPPAPDKNTPQPFWDTWWQGLPMDNLVSDILMPTAFTEIWMDINDTQAIMKKMLAYFQKAGYAATGSFSFELYAAKASNFWMSPSYGMNVFRFDVFWFKYNAGDIQKFYQQFWDELAGFNFRLHWGKYLAGPGSGQGPEYLAKQYPKWQDFLNLRSGMDPDNLFLSDYWKSHLGI